MKLRGTATGDVNLRVEIAGYNGPAPMFKTVVLPLRAAPVVAWIATDELGIPSVLESHVVELIEQANQLFRQVCVSCYLHQVSFTNRPDWIDMGIRGTPSFETKLAEMVAVPNPIYGIEVHFVGTMTGLNGVNTTHGMVLAATAESDSFVHEAGHAMRLSDIYAWHPDTNLCVTGIVEKDRCRHDWFGDAERGFYPNADNLPQSNLVQRLIMHGIAVPGRRDFSYGAVFGLCRKMYNPDEFELADAPVGVYPANLPAIPAHD